MDKIREKACETDHLLKGGLLLFGSVLFGVNAAMLLHELGHAIAMWATGTTVDRILVSPFAVSRCIAGSSVAYPRLILWGGSALGSFMGLSLFGLVWRWRGPYVILPMMTAVLSCLHNGGYLIFDGAANFGGDATLLILFGTPKVWIFVAGSLMVGLGILLGLLSLPSIGIRSDDGFGMRVAVFAGGTIPYAATIVVQMIVSGPVERHWSAACAAVFAGLVLVAAGLTKVVQSRVRWFRGRPAKTVSWGAVGLANVSGVVLLTVLVMLSGSAGFVVEKSNPSVDYVAWLNRLGKAGRDERDNAEPLYERAIEFYGEPSDEMDLKMTYRWPGEIPEAQLRLWEEWLESNSDALELMEVGARKNHYWHQYKGESLWGIDFPELGVLRRLTDVLVVRAKLSAAAGRVEDAIHDLTLCYRFGLHMRESLPLIEQLLGTAVCTRVAQDALLIIARSDPDEALLQGFQSEMEQLVNRRPGSFDLRMAKLEILDAIQIAFTDDGKGDGWIHVGAVLRLISSEVSELRDCLSDEQILRFCELRRRQTIETVERVFRYIDTVVKKTPWELRKEAGYMIEDLTELLDGNYFVEMLLPTSIRLLVSLSSQCKTDSDALITTLALLRYKAKQGQFPGNLQELVSAAYLKELPIDPYSGKSLVYRRTSGSFILYSFGADFDDDDGIPSDWGTGEQGGDQIFWPPQIIRRDRSDDKSGIDK